jgi:hypothetical protein
LISAFVLGQVNKVAFSFVMIFLTIVAIIFFFFLKPPPNKRIKDSFLSITTIDKNSTISAGINQKSNEIGRLNQADDDKEYLSKS